MKRSRIFALIAGCGLSVAACHALAGPCSSVKDYAQYKDDTASNFGRFFLALEHCRAASSLDNIALNKLDAAQCEAQKSRTLDALKTSKDQRRIVWASKGCPDPPPT